LPQLLQVDKAEKEAWERFEAAKVKMAEFFYEDQVAEASRAREEIWRAFDSKGMIAMPSMTILLLIIPGLDETRWW